MSLNPLSFKNACRISCLRIFFRYFSRPAASILTKNSSSITSAITISLLSSSQYPSHGFFAEYHLQKPCVYTPYILFQESSISIHHPPCYCICLTTCISVLLYIIADPLIPVLHNDLPAAAAPWMDWREINPRLPVLDCKHLITEPPANRAGLPIQHRGQPVIFEIILEWLYRAFCHDICPLRIDQPVGVPAVYI